MKIRDIYQLIEVAARVFAEKGFDQTRIEDIAAKLGLVKGSLYYHVSGKPGLLVLPAGRCRPQRPRLRDLELPKKSRSGCTTWLGSRRKTSTLPRCRRTSRAACS
ncbi:MAG: helix-turn-helix domain-containing protein [Tepidiformaceae bacterium]